MKTKLGIGILLLVTLTTFAQTNNLTSLLQQGLFEEQANRNLDAAIADYQSLAAQFDKDRKIAATAIFRLGECYRAQGKTNAAAAQYQRVLQDFSDQTTLATLSRQNLAGMGITSATQSAKESEGVMSDTESKEIVRIRQMIQNSPDLINAPKDGSTPLVKAAYNGWLKVAAYLLAHGANVNPPSSQVPGVPSSRITPLMAAVMAGNKAMTQFLIDHGADVNFQNPLGYTPLHSASQKGFQAVTKTLLVNHAEVNIKDNSGATPLFSAVQNGQLKIAQMLLAAGAKVNLKDNWDRTVLNYAIAGESPEIMKALLQAGANLNTEDNSGRTPLSYAAEQGNPAVVKMLVEAKADPNGGKLDMPLLVAIHKGDTNSAQLLLRAGANPNARGKVTWEVNYGNVGHNDAQVTPLFLAVYSKNLPMVQMLLQFKADPNDTQTDNRSLLFMVLDKPEIVSALLDDGAKVNVTEAKYDPSARQNYYQTLLQAAVYQNRPETVALLLQHGANPNARDERGNTVLHYATGRPASERIFALLLDDNENPNVRNDDGKTPLDVLRHGLSNNQWKGPFESLAAKKEQLTKLIALLHQHGALDNLPDWNSITISRPSANYSAAVFRKGTNDWNHFTLLETIFNYYQSGGDSSNAGSFQERLKGIIAGQNKILTELSFPDLAHVIIVRPHHNSTNKTRIEINLLNNTNGIDCSKDVPLLFGDTVEIPERDHALGEPRVGLSNSQIATLQEYLTGKVTLVAHGEKVELPIRAYGDYSRIGHALNETKAQNILLSSSDLSRVKVVRTNPETGKKQEWILDCGNLGKAPDLWLQDGDVIEVPEKP